MTEHCVFEQLDTSLIHALELGVPHVISLTSSGDVTMTVTLIDARHCPGSVMFLFDGYFGRILYTGDFRYAEDMFDHGCLSELKSNPVDVLYIDNTFCSPKCVLPSRQEAKRQIINITEQHPMERVVFGLCGLGKEDILIALSKWFNVKVMVSKERYRLLEVLALHERFVTAGESCQQTRFEVVELVEITRSSVEAWNTKTPTIAVLLTGLFVGLGYQPFTGSSDIFVVPLSDHSPYAELHEFVAQIRPKFVVPIVPADPGSHDDPLAASLLDRSNVECFAEHLDNSPMQNYHIPLSVLDKMNNTGNTRNQTRKQSSNNCRKSVSDNSSFIGTSRQNLAPNSSSAKVLASTSTVISDTAVAASDSKSDCLRWKPMNTFNAGVTSIRKPRVAVRPMKRCLGLPRDQCLQSGLIKQQQRYLLNFPASVEELHQKRFVMNDMLRQQRKRLPLSRYMASSCVPSMNTKHSTFPDADVFPLKQGNGVCESHSDMLVVTTSSNETHDPCSTLNHSVSVSGYSRSKNSAESENSWPSDNPVKTVIQVAESQANTGGTMTNSVACDQECCKSKKKTNELETVLPSFMVFNHSCKGVKTLAHNVDSALNHSTYRSAITQPAFHRIPHPLVYPEKHWYDSVRRHHGYSSRSVLEDLPVLAITDLSERVCSESGSADAMSSLDDGAVACNVYAVPCDNLSRNQTPRVRQAKSGTAVEIDELPGTDEMSHPPEENAYNMVPPMDAGNVNRFVGMSVAERYPSTQSESEALALDSYCETAVFAGDRGTADSPVTIRTGLSDVVDEYSNHTCEVLPVSGVERETGTHSGPKSDAEPKLDSSAYVQGELQHNASAAPSTQVSSLPPKKKWRRQFRASQVYRLHQENRQVSVCEGQMLTAKRPFSALESSKTCRGGSTSSINLLSQQSSICPVAKRAPLLTNYSCAAADVNSRSVSCTSCQRSATMPCVTGAAGYSDCVRWHTSDDRIKEQPTSSLLTSSTLDQQKSTSVATLPLDLSVCRKSVHRNCRLGKDCVPRTVSDVALFR